MIKRKMLFVLLGVLGAAGAVVSQQFGLTADLGAAVVGLTSLIVYVFNEGQADKARLAAQKAKWGDPKFIMTLVSAVIAGLGTSGVNLPVSPELISGILTVIVGALFKKQAAA